jgi:hypothetical protein
MNIEITQMTVESRPSKRVDDRRNKRYVYEVGFSLVCKYKFDEEELDPYDATKHARRISGLMQRSIGRDSEESRDRFTTLITALFSYYQEQCEPTVTSVARFGPPYSSTFERGRTPCFYVNFGFTFEWPKPSAMPTVEVFELDLEVLKAFFIPHAEALLANAMAEFAQEQLVEKAAQDALQLVEAVRLAANTKAKEACRFEQRLAALQAEYATEFALQVCKILDDDAEWAEALESGCSAYAISFVREQRSEIQKATRLGLIRGGSVRSDIVKRTDVAAHVEAKQETNEPVN